MFHVIPSRTVLQLGESRVVPSNTEYVSSGLCLIVFRGDCRVLVEVRALLNTVLI